MNKKYALSPALSLKGEGELKLESPISLPLQGEGKGGGLKGGVTRNASKKIIQYAKQLRTNLTEVEKQLWYHLRAQRFSHYKFRRQHPIGDYVVDFVCLQSKLIIEIDGGQHSKRIAYDKKRSLFLESKRFSIIRFWNNDIMENVESVLQKIFETLSPKGRESEDNKL